MLRCGRLCRGIKSNASQNPYPYPKNPHPTPHQIFHLPQNASQKAVKNRCKLHIFNSVNTCIHTGRFSDYELVRIYHPDSPVLQALNEPPDFSRFHAITVAYDALRGKSSSPRPVDSDVSLGRNSEAAMVKARMAERARRAEFLESGKDERWKEWIFMGAILLVWSLSFNLDHLFLMLTYCNYPRADGGRFRSTNFLD
jgi:hypothetical protein